MPVDGPRTATSTLDSGAHTAWVLKRLLTGASVAGYTAGAWTVMGSSDGTTAAMDGVDRWLTEANVVYSIATATPHSWIVLRSPAAINGTYCYLLIGCQENGASSQGNVHVSPGPYSGNSTTADPTSAISNGNGVANPFFSDDVTNPQRFYGALSTVGDFILFSTIQGIVRTFHTVMNPVGCKSNDQFPYFAWLGAGTGVGPMVSGALNVTGGVTTSLRATMDYALVAAGTRWLGLLHPPAASTAQVDVTDSSVYDFPAWVMVNNASGYTTATVTHPRGRLPDVGIIGSLATAPPVAAGNTILVNGNIAYVTAGNLLLPYNAPVS